MRNERQSEKFQLEAGPLAEDHHWHSEGGGGQQFRIRGEQTEQSALTCAVWGRAWWLRGVTWDKHTLATKPGSDACSPHLEPLD